MYIYTNYFVTWIVAPVLRTPSFVAECLIRIPNVILRPGICDNDLKVNVKPSSLL